MIVHYVKGDWVKLAKVAMKRHTPLWFGHGANCQKRMGAGIAAQIKKQLPELYEVDQRSNPVLGGTSFYYPRTFDFSCALINLYTQFDIGADARYNAVASCFRKLEKIISELPSSERPAYMVIPKICSDIGGLKWDLVEKVINEVTPNLKVIVIEWDQNG